MTTRAQPPLSPLPPLPPSPCPWSLISELQGSLVWFYPGAAQGITTVLLGHPLDTAKTRLQADHNQTLKTRSSLRVMVGMFQKEGAKSLYRGVTPPLVVMGSKRSLQFALWERIRRPVSTTEGSSSSSRTRGIGGGAFDAVSSSALHFKSVMASSNFLSGAFSGAVGTILGCPMHVIKIQTQNGSTPDSRNAFHCARHVWREEGIRGYYRGFPAHVLKDVLFAGTYLGLYETIRVKLTHPATNTTVVEKCADSSTSPPDVTTTSSKPSHLSIPKLSLPSRFKDSHPRKEEDDGCASITSPSPRSGNIVVFASGTIASCFTWVFLYPFDTLKTAIQAKNPLTLKTFLTGPGGFIDNPYKAYRGLAAALFRAGPVSGLAMVAYESVKAQVNSA